LKYKLTGCTSLNPNSGGKSGDPELKRRIRLAKEVLSYINWMQIPLEVFNKLDSNDMFRYVLSSAVNESNFVVGVPFESAIDSMRNTNWSELNPLRDIIITSPSLVNMSATKGSLWGLWESAQKLLGC